MSIGEKATQACILEATAPKPGNVHPGAPFEDMDFEDMVASARVLGPVMDQAATLSVGELVLQSVQAIHRRVAKNTYLGTVLLFAPLARAATLQTLPLPVAVGEVLENLTADDARCVYAAIRAAKPGGLGHEATYDVHATPPSDLVAAMRHAASRDLVARQYTNQFADVFEFIVPRLQAARATEASLQDAIVWLHVQVMARYPDSLILRKSGIAVANESARRAAAVVQSRTDNPQGYAAQLSALDCWLRGDGRRRNPGTTADLVAAALFADMLMQHHA